MEVKEEFDEAAVKRRYKQLHDKSFWLSEDVSFWWFQLNPFRDVSVEQIKKASFINKWLHVLHIFTGDQEKTVSEESNEKQRVPKDPKPCMEKDAGLSGAWNYFRQRHLIWEKPGILDYCLLFLPQWIDTYGGWSRAQEVTYKKHLALGVSALLLALPYFLLVLGRLIVSVILALALSPVILLVHVFLGPEEEDGSTPLRQSLFFNPSTWMIGSILLAATGLLIQGLNPAIFAQAAVTLGIMQTVFVGMAAVTLVGGLLYTIGYAAYKRFKYRAQNSLESSADLNPNPFIKYLSERWNVISSNPGVFLLIWVIGLSVFGFVIALTMNYFESEIADYSLLGPLCGFMSQVFFVIIHALAGLPGLGFLSGISGPTLVLVGHILSAVMLSMAVFFITDNVSRMVETIMPKDLNAPNTNNPNKAVDDPKANEEEPKKKNTEIKPKPETDENNTTESSPIFQPGSIIENNTPSLYKINSEEHIQNYNLGKRLYRAINDCKASPYSRTKNCSMVTDNPDAGEVEIKSGELFWLNPRRDFIKIGFYIYARHVQDNVNRAVNCTNLQEEPVPTEFISACKQAKQVKVRNYT